MSLSGPEAMRALEDALRDVRREEDDISRRLARSADLIAKTRETETELFRQLAAVRLDPETQKELTGRLSAAELRARDVQKAHAAALSEAEEQLASLDRTLGELSARRAEAVKRAAEQQDRLDTLRERIRAQLEADPQYKERRDAARNLASIAAESQAKTAQAERDREEKGRPYRDDRLFMYLWERGYGTPGYRANSLIRYLDGQVAQLIDYARARPNFAILNEIPLRLKEHADRQASLAASAEQELTAREDAVIDAAGGKPVREALAATEAEIEKVDAEVIESEDKRDETAKRLHELAQGEDAEFARAVAVLADTLDDEDVATLLADARATRTDEDDALLGQIDSARARAAEEERDTREQKERLGKLAARRRELEDIQYEFRRARFDDPRSRFGENALTGELLTDFLRGALSAAVYWNRWRQAQSWQGGMGPWVGVPSTRSGGFNWPDNSFGGGSGGSWGGGSGGNWGRLPGGHPGGGFSRPRTGSGGSRNYGGFKTGGGF
jgi:hypothetical protein